MFMFGTFKTLMQRNIMLKMLKYFLNILKLKAIAYIHHLTDTNDSNSYTIGHYMWGFQHLIKTNPSYST